MESDLNKVYLEIFEESTLINLLMDEHCKIVFHSMFTYMFYKIYKKGTSEILLLNYIYSPLTFLVLKGMYENPEKLFKNIIQFNIDETYVDTYICEILGAFKGSSEIESMEVSLIESLMLSGFNFQENKYSTHTCMVWETEKGLVFEVCDGRS